MTEYVAGFLFAEGGKVALIRKARPAWQRGRLNGIGGHIEPGETPQEAMAREFFEETGLPNDEADWTNVVRLEGRDWRVYFFSATTDRQQSVLRDDTDEPCAWYDCRNLPDDVLHNLRWLIPLCLDTDALTPIVVHDSSLVGEGMTKADE